MSPAAKLVGPGLNSEQVTAGLGRRETTTPPIIAVQTHRLPPPSGLRFLAPQQFGRELVMAFTQEIGPDVERLTDNPLDRVSTAIDGRIDILDQETRTGGIVRCRFGNVWNTHRSVAGNRQRSSHVCSGSHTEGFLDNCPGKPWFQHREPNLPEIVSLRICRNTWPRLWLPGLKRRHAGASKPPISTFKAGVTRLIPGSQVRSSRRSPRP